MLICTLNSRRRSTAEDAESGCAAQGVGVCLGFSHDDGTMLDERYPEIQSARAPADRLRSDLLSAGLDKGTNVTQQIEIAARYAF